MGPPIFIIGNPRSGTTLLRLMLTCHRNIVIPPECGFAVWLHDKYESWAGSDDLVIDRFVADVLECRKIETWQVDEEGLLGFLKNRRPDSYAAAVSLVYEWYGLSAGETFTRWGDKNNFYLDYIPTIKAMFPAAHFVHIVRDGRNVACSYRRLAATKIESRYAPRLPHEIDDIARQWKQNIETIDQSFNAFGHEHVQELRLEDLVRDPQEQLTRVCELLGEEYDAGMLEYHRVNEQRQLEPQEFLQWKEKTLKPPTPEQNDEYQSKLTADEITRFEAIAGDTLRKHGYIGDRR